MMISPLTIRVDGPGCSSEQVWEEEEEGWEEEGWEEEDEPALGGETGTGVGKLLPFSITSVISFNTLLVLELHGRLEGGDRTGDSRVSKFSERNNIISEINCSFDSELHCFMSSPVPGSITPTKGEWTHV